MTKPIENVSTGLSSWLPQPTARNLTIGVALAAILGLSLLWLRSRHPDPQQKTDKPAAPPSAVASAATVQTAGEAEPLNQRLIKALNLSFVDNPCTLEQIEDFLQRGGKINLVEENTSIQISQKEKIYAGCSSGINRSQTLHALLTDKKCNVGSMVLAGADTHINPFCEYPSPHRIPPDLNEAFKAAFSRDKAPKLGYLVDPTTRKETPFSKKRFKDWFTATLKPSHFILFAASGGSVLRQLLEREGRLDGFTITFIPWNDEIVNPPVGIESNSAEAFRAVYGKLQNHFTFIP